MMKWIAFAEGFPTDSQACFGVLKQLNEELIAVSVLLGNGLRPSEADIIVFSAIHSSVVCTLGNISFLFVCMYVCMYVC